MDDLNKTLPVSNTPQPASSNFASAHVGDSSSASLSPSSSGSATTTFPLNSGSSTSTPLSSTHEADSLDKILADLEAQLKAKQDGSDVSDKKDVAKTDAPKINSSPSAVAPQTHKPTELVVEEKHELMPIKSDAASIMKTASPILSTSSSASHSPSVSTPPIVEGLTTSHVSSHVASSTPNPIAEHPFVPGSGVAAALKKVVPETVGAVSVMGMSSMKKDAAIPNTDPPKMPGIADIKMGGNTVNGKPPSKFGQAMKKMGKLRIVAGALIFLFISSGLIGVSFLVKRSQDNRPKAAWCAVYNGDPSDGNNFAGYVPCDDGSPPTIQGTYEQVMNIRDNAPAVTDVNNAEQLNAVVDQVGTANVNNGVIDGGTHGGQETVSSCSGDSCNTGNEGNGAAVGGSGNTTVVSGGTPNTGTVGGGTPTGNGTTADNACTAQDFCGGPNQGYCTCGADGKPDPKGKPTCQGGYEVLGGDCVPIGTKERTGTAPAPEGTHCQSNGECGNGLECSSHVCTKPAPTPSTTTTTGTQSGDIVVPGTNGKLVIRNGRIVVTDLVTGQTIGNMCDLPNSGCDTYDKWVKGYYDAKKPENFGVKAPNGKPVYTDILTDLDPKSPLTQVGTIKYDDLKKEWYIDGIATINLDSSLSDDAKKAKSNNGGVSVSSLATSYTVNSDGTLKYAGQTLTGAASGIPKGWELAVGKSCASGALTCGDSAKGTGFCVPLSEQDGKTTCDGYFKRFGIPVRYQAVATIVSSLFNADGKNGCGVDKEDLSASTLQTTQGTLTTYTCSANSIYSICTPYLNGEYKCYPRTQNGAIPAGAKFSLTNNGDCLSGGTIAAYSCPPDTSGGCQSGSVPISGSKVCIQDIAKAVGGCGKTIQIDADDGTYHYSINEWLPACGTPTIDTPPQRFNNPPPTTNEVCTNCGGGPEPTPSPAPPGSPVCVGINASIPSPRLGDAPTFTCSPAAEATRYEFRSKIGSGAYATLSPSAANSNVSSPLTVNASGVYTIQCRPCNANGCANWENL